jgi:5'-3' exonuclease
MRTYYGPKMGDHSRLSLITRYGGDALVIGNNITSYATILTNHFGNNLVANEMLVDKVEDLKKNNISQADIDFEDLENLTPNSIDLLICKSNITYDQMTDLLYGANNMLRLGGKLLMQIPRKGRIGFDLEMLRSNLESLLYQFGFVEFNYEETEDTIYAIYSKESE